MNIVKRSLFIVMISAFAVLAGQAQSTRTWVSSGGDDAAPCSRTAPCKTLAAAYLNTATGGEIDCIDRAAYGPLTIAKSLTIDCGNGSILQTGGNGLTINIAALDAKKSVKITGLSINGGGSGTDGIKVMAVNQLVIEDVSIEGFTQHGISLETTTGSPKVFINNCEIKGSAGNGINTFMPSATLGLAINNCRIEMNATGINLSSGTKATVTNSTIMGNNSGVTAFNGDMLIKDSNISHNTTGIQCNSGSTIRITNNAITNNGTGLAASGGTIISFMSNVFQGNTIDGGPTTVMGLQ
jgi:hypothetical protein